MNSSGTESSTLREDVEERLANALQRVQDGMRLPRMQERELQFLRPAAVLWQFTPSGLVPDGERAQPGEAERVLCAHVVRLRATGKEPLWTLRDNLRPVLLESLGDAEVCRLRPLYCGPVAAQQAIVDRWMCEPDIDLGTYSLDQLAIVSRMRTWFKDPPSWFPTLATIERLRATARFREPLTGLVGPAFSGRAKELATIRDFVESPHASGPAVMVVRGVGGVGKSTLAAKFLLQVLGDADQQHLVMYLDFDMPTLDIGDGVTLLLEMATQAAAQRPGDEKVAAVVASAIGATQDLATGRGKSPGRAIAVHESARELAEELGAAIRDAGVTQVTLTLDTFEEMQFANADHQENLQQHLELLDKHLPSLRTLVVSRAHIEIKNAQDLEVGDLDEEASRALLGAKGITDETQVASVLAVSGGNPLSLRLAADLLRAEGHLGLVHATHERIEHEIVQGQLYRRILQHVHEPEVQRLAHPGLIVRRVTADVIRQVLAVPCGLGDVSKDRADDLFEKLAREVSLVRRSEADVVEHRSDVRRIMLKLIYRDRPALARQVHERAARFYQKQVGDVAAAEEAYHRFALGETEGPWLMRLTPAAATRLQGALEELPDHVWPILASYVGIDLPKEKWDAASVVDHERRVVARCRELMEKDQAEKVLKVLEEFGPLRASSALWRWQGRAYAMVGMKAEAIEALHRSLATLEGPAEEAAKDVALLRELIGDDPTDNSPELGDELPNTVPTSYSVSPALEVDTPDQSETRLDDREFRTLIGKAIGNRTYTIAVEGLPQSAPSTRAAKIYAYGVKLNEATESIGGIAPIDAWKREVSALSPTFQP